ncbi:hypothetical protein JR316_0011876 [Psilocybe cubensis]|uniref:Uncharacterized protein n=2 Tax=Psilocybe cubensis TaxID=181762 RepID=A0A8H7XNE1_PSICU|nr:hypothetical protein JR316_0011876 [Psilocybe cubensis]KAH9476302.1 hypothetical protein JR316_0011876 [Psilocybe cubensis]
MAARHEPAYIEDATLSQCQLVLDEMNENTVEQIRDAVFQATTSSTRPGGSSIENWFKKVSQGNTAYRVTMKNSGLKTRIIAWKKGTNFGAANLYFRTVSPIFAFSGMHIKAFGIFSTTKQKWTKPNPGFNSKSSEFHGGTRFFRPTCRTTDNVQLFDMLIMRNMLDFDGADIPIIFVDWSSEQLDIALGYWEELSKDNWSRDEQRKRCKFIQNCQLCLGFGYSDVL